MSCFLLFVFFLLCFVLFCFLLVLVFFTGASRGLELSRAPAFRCDNNNNNILLFFNCSQSPGSAGSSAIRGRPG